jgi:dihydropteroate synthase
VIGRLARETGAVISTDTMKAAVAERALEAGARIINDVSALTFDPRMADAARAHGAGVILMHMRGSPRSMQDNPQYDNVGAEVRRYLEARLDAAIGKGLEEETLAVDPGIGFGKTVEHNIQLLAELDRLTSLGRPVVVGVSNKSFLGKLTGREVGERQAASLAAVVFSIMRGAGVVRVHDVPASVDAVRVVGALMGR